MKLSPQRASALALVIGLVGAASVAACADSEAVDIASSSVDSGVQDSASPRDAADASEAASPLPEASVDAGPKLCSDHGFCPTALPGQEQTVEGIWGDGAGVVWAATTEGDLLRWDGSAWTVHASGLGALHTVWGSGPTDVWVGGDVGVLHGTGSSPASLTFTPSTLPGDPTPILSIWGPSGDDVWAVGYFLDPNTFESFQRVVHYTAAEGGAEGQWELDPISSNEAVAYTRVWGSQATGVWVGAMRGPFDPVLVVLRKTDGGDFEEVTLPRDPDPNIEDFLKDMTLVGATVISDTSVTIYGQPIEPEYPHGTAWHGTSADNGKTFTFAWATDDRTSAPAITRVFGNAADDVWEAGDYGRLLHWDGSTWSPKAVTVTKYPVTDPFLTVWAHGPSEVWVGGKNMALRYDPTQVKSGGVQ